MRTRAGDGRPLYVLPSDLSGSLRQLDDAQLDRLLRAVTEEARRRGRPAGGEHTPPQASAADRPAGPAPSGGSKAKRRPLPLAPGQARLVRAAFEAGVKPAAIARQLRVSRAQVDRVLGERERKSR